MRRPRYIICAHPYDENSGGSVVLHRLAYELCRLGESVAIRPTYTRRSAGRLGFIRERIDGRTFILNDHFPVPIEWRRRMGADDIVIYSETVAGNPLRAHNVVRWLLHRPGFHTGIIKFGPDDMYFKYANFADDPAITGGLVPKLSLFTIPPAYFNPGPVARTQLATWCVRASDGP